MLIAQRFGGRSGNGESSLPLVISLRACDARRASGLEQVEWRDAEGKQEGPGLIEATKRSAAGLAVVKSRGTNENVQQSIARSNPRDKLVQIRFHYVVSICLPTREFEEAERELTHRNQCNSLQYRS